MVRLDTLRILPASRLQGAPRDWEKALVRLEQACQLGDGQGCAWLALGHRHFGKALAEIEAVSKKGCDAGSATACLAVLAAKRRARPPAEPSVLAELAAQVRALAQPGCDKGRGDDCSALSTLQRLTLPGSKADNAGADASEKQALDLFQRGCIEGDPIACSSYADVMILEFLPDESLDDDGPPGLLATLKKGCEVGARVACASLAVIVQASAALGSPQERELEKKACELGEAEACPEREKIALKRKECAMGNAFACSSLASALSRAHGVPESEVEEARARARTLAVASCKNGGFCGIAAVMLERGQGGPVDLPGAVELLEIECARGAACHQLAARLVKSTDAASRSRGLSMLEAPCAADAMDCEDLAAALNGEGGSLVKKDAKRAQSLRDAMLARATSECAAGNASSCTTASLAYSDKSTWAKPDPAKYLAFTKRACELGSRSSCQFIEMMESLDGMK